MKIFGKKKYGDDPELFEMFFREIKKRAFEIKLKTKDQEGKTVSCNDCDVIKLSSLNDIVEKHFGFSMKDCKAFTRDHVV